MRLFFVHSRQPQAHARGSSGRRQGGRKQQQQCEERASHPQGWQRQQHWQRSAAEGCKGNSRRGQVVRNALARHSNFGFWQAAMARPVHMFATWQGPPSNLLLLPGS